MKKIIGLILIMLMLSGCNVVYDLDNFVMPDDTEFMEVVKELNTPEKIGNYMLANFEYKQNLFYNPNPYIVWKTKKGVCADFAKFGMFIANYHGYETYRVEIYYKGLINHMIAVYKESNGYTFTSNRKYYEGAKDSFKECIMSDYIKYKVFDYDGNLIEVGE
jgi:hypothetical protein